MEKHLEQLKAALAANAAIKERTPFLDVAGGALRTAIDNTEEHLRETERQAKAKAKAK